MTDPRSDGSGADASDMDDFGRGDDVYQPDDSEIREDAGPLEPEDTLDDRGVEDVLDEGYSPPERPLAVEGTGTTAEEQEEGDSLDERLARERPDAPLLPDGDGLGDESDTDGELLDPEAGDRRAGRLTATDQWVKGPTQDGVADDIGIDGGAASAEEAAVHIVDDPEADPDGDL
ncbi:hypothetical protein SAMN05216251_110168 [Actinacidiphila alni]|uniref:DUF5709 domain-containing protein n=1 Tax=Actinacidiphila alni TaxID=380248 RepID=A0A1I2HBH5_9ACTN|nr:hypothetical protein SAMN05216251_110168 [Actinacidiphila alni]